MPIIFQAKRKKGSYKIYFSNKEIENGPSKENFDYCMDKDG